MFSAAYFVLFRKENTAFCAGSGCGGCIGGVTEDAVADAFIIAFDA